MIDIISCFIGWLCCLPPFLALVFLMGVIKFMPPDIINGEVDWQEPDEEDEWDILGD